MMSQEPTPIDAQHSQGLIQNPQGSTEQHFGNEQHVDTGGGDAAGENIDKRTFINIFMGVELSSLQSVQSIQALLQELEQKGLDRLVKRVYRESLPADFDVSRPIAANTQDMVTQLEEFRRLQIFLDRLVRETEIPPAIRNQLDELRRQQDLSTWQQTAPTPTINGKEGLQAYLQIVVSREKSASRDTQQGLVVNAWLIRDDRIIDRAKRHQPLDLDERRKGAACQMEDVPTIVNQFLNRALEHLVGEYDELTIEVFLPLDYLCREVDRWEMLADLGFEEETFVVGTRYQVIVRSQERLDRRYLIQKKSQWQTNWKRVETRLSSMPEPDDFEHLNQMSACNWKQLANRLEYKLGLKLTCGLVEASQKELFKCLLKAASPIAIWSRLDVPNIDQVGEIDRLFASGPLFSLLKSVRKHRQEADCAHCPASHLGSHLAVLWENPNRLTPDALAQLRPPGQ